MNISSDVQKLVQFLKDVYVDRVGDDKLQPARLQRTNSLDTASYATKTFANATSPLSMPPMLSHVNNLPSPSTPDTNIWEPTAAASPIQAADDERPKYPAFVPADYIKMRKPWEAEMRKNAATYAVEISVTEDNPMIQRHQTPSVKTKRFKRSMVNLLRTKSSVTTDMRYE